MSNLVEVPIQITTPQGGVLPTEKILDLLWSRVRQRGNLPGFSRVVDSIVGAMRGDNDREFNMTKTVLSDPALTQRVLRLANSAMYSVFGQEINTVSKAVLVLGTDSIGHLALGLKLIDGLSDASSESITARVEMEKALLAGHIARQVVAASSTFDAEEAAVCSMLHSLGRMMVAFYLPEFWQAMQALSARDMSETQAAQSVLGLKLDAVGRLVAQQWGLPTALIDSLQDVDPQVIGEPLTHADWLAAVSTLSARCSDVVHSTDNDSADVTRMIEELANDYSLMLGLEPCQLSHAVETATTVAEAEEVFAKPRSEGRLQSSASRKQNTPVVRQAGKPDDAAQLLAKGIADMRSAVETASTAQLLTMALETVFKGLGFSRTIAFLRNPDQARYVARLIFGDGLQDIASRLAFGDAYQPDVFHAALANDKMIFIENAQDPTFSSKLPRWWRDALPTAKSFVLLPISINRHPIGLLYGDWDLSLPAAKISQSEIPPLDELRRIVVKAIEHRRQVDPNWGSAML